MFVFASLLFTDDFISARNVSVRVRNAFRGAQRRRQKPLGKNVFLAVFVHFHAHVFVIGVHAQRHVRRQRPGRRRPGENIRILFALHSEFHERGFLLHVLIALRHFVRRKRRAATRAVRHNLMPLVQKPLFVHRFQRPPLRFDVIVVIRYVRGVHIAPVPYAVGHFLPLFRVLPYGLFTLFYKRLYAVRLDFRLVVEAEFFLHFQFHGQPVRIPARLS